jgi:hypothetical protein
VPISVKMEVSNHPELQEKLQELEHELEVSPSVSKKAKSVLRLSRVWAQFCLGRKKDVKGWHQRMNHWLTFDIHRREILQKRGRQSLVYAGQTEQGQVPSINDICF